MHRDSKRAARAETLRRKRIRSTKYAGPTTGLDRRLVEMHKAA